MYRRILPADDGIDQLSAHLPIQQTESTQDLPLLPLPSADTSFQSNDTDHLLKPHARSVGASSTFEIDDNPDKQLSDRLTKYNPFTLNGRARLRRKLLASGPANSSSGNVEGEAGPTQSRPGWHKGAWVCCIGVALCIVIELVLLIWAVSTSIGGRGSGLLFEGNCDEVKNLTLWLLLPLNIAATMLIGTSNYIMQIANAPSRSEIDRAHAFARSVVVCGMGLQNLEMSRGGRFRRIVWWTLMLSSLPIHLLLNSAIYSSVQASNTGVLIVSEDFRDDTSWRGCNTSLRSSSPSSSFACSLLQFYDAGITTQMSWKQCLSQYATGFQTNASSVLVVTAAGSDSWNSPPSHAQVPASYGTACWNSSQVEDSSRSFRFTYNETAGSAVVDLAFEVHCTETTEVEPMPNGTRASVSTYSGSQPDAYKSAPDTLFFAADDILTKISSIRSVFDAIGYRYWVTAELTGDFLKPSITALDQGWDASSWLCPTELLAKGRLCDATTLLTNTNWSVTPAAMPVTECHVYPKPETCTLRYSWRILVVTIFCDVTKLVAMVLTLKFMTQPLTTIGDVISSFLQNPDPYTKGRCLLDDVEARKLTAYWERKKYALQTWQMCLRAASKGYDGDWRLWRLYEIPFENPDPDGYAESSQDWLLNGGLWWTSTGSVVRPQPWVTKKRSWYMTPSRTRWITWIALYIGLVTVVVVYFTLGFKSLRSKGLSSAWTAGLGGPDPNALWDGGLMSGASDVTWVAVLVNLPQVIFSLLYYIFNAMFTMMYTAHEWAELSGNRKALRVSSPRGQQRSTYWLQLPWAYSIPLITASGSLHWLLGRSIYLVKVEAYGYFGQPQPENDFFACGYSLITTLVLIVILALMGMSLLLVSQRKLRAGSPFVTFNSLAISAACHPDPSEKDIALRPLMWGVVDGDKDAGVKHCSFSAKEVSPLREGEMYA